MKTTLELPDDLMRRVKVKAAQENRRSFKGYLRALRNPGEWKRIADGGVDIKAVVSVLIKRTARGIYNTGRSMLPPAEGAPAAPSAAPAEGAAPAAPGAAAAGRAIRVGTDINRGRGASGRVLQALI